MPRPRPARPRSARSSSSSPPASTLPTTLADARSSGAVRGRGSGRRRLGGGGGDSPRRRASSTQIVALRQSGRRLSCVPRRTRASTSRGCTSPWLHSTAPSPASLEQLEGRPRTSRPRPGAVIGDDRRGRAVGERLQRLDAAHVRARPQRRDRPRRRAARRRVGLATPALVSGRCDVVAVPVSRLPPWRGGRRRCSPLERQRAGFAGEADVAVGERARRAAPRRPRRRTPTTLWAIRRPSGRRRTRRGRRRRCSNARTAGATRRR